jgi:hypothetical protein
MQKTLRIFRKDTRHLWPEILLTLALTLGFALTEHYLWPTFSSISGAGVYRTLTMWINVLMPIAWWLLIARAVHDESLVGDLQFWVTRPYGWQRVLTAKLLFLAAFILVPFLLAQCYLLHQAGLHPLAVLPGLLLKLLILFAFLLLPLLALSTVTASLTRMLLVFIGFFIYLGLATYFSTLILPNSPPWTPGTGSSNLEWFALLLPVTGAVVTLLQYARRRTLLSSGILVGLVLVLTGVLIAATRIHGDINAFPLITVGQSAPMQVSFNPNPPTTPQTLEQLNENLNGFYRSDSMATRIDLPMLVSSIAPGHAVQVEGISDHLQSEEIPQTDDRWHMTSVIYTPGPQPAHPIFQSVLIPEDTLRKSHGKPFTIGLAYAVNDYVAEIPTIIPYAVGPIDIPQNGHCTSTKYSSLDCQYALKSPDFTLVTWKFQQTCGTTSPADLNQQQWIGDNEPFLNPEFNPVAMHTSFQTSTASKTQPYVHLCPGSPITFTRYHLLSRHRIEVTLPPLDPKQYILKADANPNPDPDE